MNREDQDHLWMLSVGHYVFAVLVAVVGAGVVLQTIAWRQFMQTLEERMPAMGGDSFQMLMLLIIIGGVCVFWAICILVAGRCLATQQGRTFCFLVAVLNCLSVPLGTVLGIFTILVLQRPSVRDAFEGISHDKPTHLE